MKKPIMEKSIMEKTAIGNITTVGKTTVEKTTIAKITAKITTTALLFFLALFTLTTNLKAQAVQDNSKSGFFAGFVYLQGFQVDSSKSISESTATISYEVTSYTDETTDIIADAASVYDNLAVSSGIEALLKANCETRATTVTVGGIDYRFLRTVLNSFDPGTETGEGTAVTTTGDGIGTVSGFFPTGTVAGETSYCYTYFYGDLSAERTLFTDYKVTADSPPVEPQVSAESDKLSGIGLQFGYRWEKWRASFTHYTGQGGDNELTNSLAIADYFFQEKFFVGAGLASIKLTNSSAEGDSISASATSPVLQVGYTENLTSNLQLSIGVLQYSSGLSLSSTTTTTTTATPDITYLEDTQTVNGDSAAVIGFALAHGGSTIRTIYFINSSGNFEGDYRTIVTQVGERTVNIEKTVTPVGGAETIEAELKAPTVIGITLHYSF